MAARRAAGRDSWCAVRQISNFRFGAKNCHCIIMNQAYMIQSSLLPPKCSFCQSVITQRRWRRQCGTFAIRGVIAGLLVVGSACACACWKVQAVDTAAVKPGPARRALCASVAASAVPCEVARARTHIVAGRVLI